MYVLAGPVLLCCNKVIYPKGIIKVCIYLSIYLMHRRISMQLIPRCGAIFIISIHLLETARHMQVLNAVSCDEGDFHVSVVNSASARHADSL